MIVNREVFRPTGWAGSVLVHLIAILGILAGSIRPRPAEPDLDAAAPRQNLQIFRFGDRPGGGGGGGDEGDLPTAAIRAAVDAHEPRRAPIAPRKPRPLSFDDLNVPDLPQEAALLLDGVFSPDAVDFPGLSLTDPRDWGGVDVAAAASAMATASASDPGTALESAPEFGVSDAVSAMEEVGTLTRFRSTSPRIRRIPPSPGSEASPEK